MMQLPRRRMAVGLSLVAVSGLALAIFLFVLDDSGPSLQEVSVEQLYLRIEDYLLEQNGVYHARIDLETDARDYQIEGTMERWVDARQNVAREQRRFMVTLPSGEQQAVTGLVIYSEDGTYNADDGQVSEGAPVDCGGTSVAITVVLGCTGFLTEVTNRTEIGIFEGDQAVVFVHEGLSVGSDEIADSTHRVYLDRETFLPFGAEADGSSPSQGEVAARYTYEDEWIPEVSLPPDFFDPAAIGFDREAAIRNASDLQVYWLGEYFEAPGVEPLVLKSTYAAPAGSPLYRYSLTYARASNPHEPPLLVLQVFFRDEWEKVSVFPDQTASFEETVIFFSEAKAEEGPNTILTPEAIEQLKAGLRPYE